MCKICVKNRRNFVKKFCRSSLGLLSVIDRSSVGELRQGIREGKETAILINSTFCILGFFSLFYVLRFSSEWGLFGRNTRSAIRGTSSSLVHPWFVLGLLHGAYLEGTKERNIKNRYSVGCRVYGVKARISVECKGIKV